MLQILIPSSSFFMLDDSNDNIGDVSNLSEIHLLFFRMQKIECQITNNKYGTEFLAKIPETNAIKTME